MKNIKTALLAFSLLFICNTTSLFAVNRTYNDTASASNRFEHPNTIELTQSLNKLQAVDKLELNFSQKQALKKEIRSNKKSLANSSGGIYISVGALLLIIILLILFL